MEIQIFLREKCKSYYQYSFVNLEPDEAGSEEVLCYYCEKPVLGTCIKDYENDYYHLSCSWVSSKMESLLLHFRSGHDDMIFTEELKNKGKEDVVCFGCEEPVVGPGYKCSAPQCKFLLHQSCAELPLNMQHPFHPDHTFSLQVPERAYFCFACGKNCNGCFRYECEECEFNLDIICYRWRAINRDHCRHVFRPFFKRMQFPCDACGVEVKDLAAQCSICQVLIHGKCGKFSRTIRITVHCHSLVLTYSLWDVREVKEDKNIFCNLCYEKIKVQYGAYLCKRCDFVAHLECAYKFFRSACEEFDDLDSDDDEDIKEELIEGAEQARHFSHHHILNLSNEELKDNKLCDGCMGLISVPFYSCTECNYFLHNKCVHLPQKKKHILHRHKLTLVSQVPYFGGLFWCDACDRVSKGFSYNCASCKFDLDVRCFSMPESLKYEGHTHTLYLAINSTKNCNACDRSHSTKKGVFVCTECELVFCFECATLPFKARHGYHKHPLEFNFTVEAFSENYYCLVCEKERNEKDWIYYCTKCDFTAHIDCVVGQHPYMKFGSSFTCEDHEHPLTFVPTRVHSQCDVCGDAFRGWAIECSQCKFIVDDRNCLQEKSELLTEAKRAIVLVAEGAGWTSASTRGARDSGAEEAGGSSVGSRGTVEIDSGVEDGGGTSAGTRGRHDLGEGIDFGKKIDSGEIDLGNEIASSAEDG